MGEPEREGTVPVADGIEIRYRVRGDGDSTPLVVPAASWLSEDLDPLWEDRRVVFYDLRGRGRSSAVLRQELLGLERDVEDLEALREALGLERFALLGWSYHGLIAARYALAHPERVERLLLVGPAAPCARWFDDFLEGLGRRIDFARLEELGELRSSGLPERDPCAWCRAVHSVFFHAYVVDPAALERMRSSPCVEPNLDAERVNDQGRRILVGLGDYDWRPECGALATPTLILHGTEDPVALGGSRDWAAALPDARLIVLEDVAHMPWLERPALFFPAVRSFLRGEWPAEAARA